MRTSCHRHHGCRTSLGADGTEVSFAYSPGGDVTGVVSVAGTTSCMLDKADRRVRMYSPAGTFGLGYCAWNGKVSAVTNANGLVAMYAYDIMDRVTNIAWHTTSGVSLGGFAYAYDATGRIVERDFSLGDPSSPNNPSRSSPLSHRTYSYDSLDRLAMDGDVSYAYDAAGNRTAKIDPANGTTLYTLGLGDRLATYGRARSPSAPQSADGSYTYDTAGNVTRIVRENGTTLDLAWNSQYQLVSVTTNGVFAESYSYDALGRRVSTTTLEGTLYHVYDDNWQCIADVGEDGAVVCSYFWGEGVDNLLAVKVGDNAYYPLTDIQGTAWGYVDSANNVVARFDYDAWGNILSSISTVPALVTNRYRFQGREWSVATGLINFRMRWYDAETGRWLSKDPIGLNGGLNLYVIFKNDPIKNVDPMGLFTSGEFLRKVQDEQDCIWRNEYEGPAMDVVETLSIFSIASVIEGIASSSTTSALAAMSDVEISNGRLAGANTTGNIIQKIGAAEKGANIARTTVALKGAMSVASKGTAVVTIGASIYYASAKTASYGAAVIITVMGWNQ